MMADISTITAGDPSMTQEYLDTFRRSEHLDPEKALLAAILADAVHDYRKFVRAQDRDGMERFHEAEHWIMEGGNDWIFSFQQICEHLALDPDYVRRGLRENRGQLQMEEKPRQRRVTHRRAA